MTPKEKYLDILDVLTQVMEFSRVPATETERKSIAQRLVQFHGVELFRLIRALPGRTYFPAGFQIEQEIRVILGEKPLRGLTSDLIDKNERELVAGGQSPAKAKIGAEVLRKTLKSKIQLPEKTHEQVDEVSAQMALPARAVEFEKSPLDALEDF